MNAPGTVLVVDDDADVRALVSELLTRAGYEVSEAPNGREALKLAVRRAARPRAARHLDARARRLGDARADPRAERRARADAERARRRAREGARAAGGRRRLRDQAVRAPGAARARRERCCGERRRRRCATPTATACSRSTSRSAACGRGTEPVELTPLEFRLLTAFVDHPGQLLAPRPAARARLGRRARLLARPGQALRRLPAPQAGCGGRPARRDRDRARLRLPLLAELTPAIGFAHGSGHRRSVAARARTENFPVASLLFPRALRPHLRAIYGFARLVDMLGDECEGDRLAALDELEREVEALLRRRARRGR